MQSIANVIKKLSWLEKNYGFSYLKWVKSSRTPVASRLICVMESVVFLCCASPACSAKGPSKARD